MMPQSQRDKSAQSISPYQEYPEQEAAVNVDPQDMGRKEKKDQLAGGNPLSAVKYKEIKIEGKEEKRDNLRADRKPPTDHQEGHKKDGDGQPSFSPIYLTAGKKEDQKGQQGEDDLKDDQPSKSTQLIYRVDYGMK
jgi:hypothetical protein